MDEVSIYSPDQPLILSEAALAHLRTRLEGSEAAGLRLALVESGCSGYMYELQYLNGEGEESQHLRVSEDVPIFVPHAQLHLVQGTRVDYVTEGLNAMLRFENPRAEASCGCGESFSIQSTEDESPSLNAG